MYVMIAIIALGFGLAFYEQSTKDKDKIEKVEPINTSPTKIK